MDARVSWEQRLRELLAPGSQAEVRGHKLQLRLQELEDDAEELQEVEDEEGEGARAEEDGRDGRGVGQQCLHLSWNSDSGGSDLP